MGSGRARGIGGDQLGKIGVAAVALQHGGHADSRLGVALYVPETLIITKIEDLVLYDGAADGSSELVPAQLTLFDSVVIFKPVRCIEHIVAKEFPGCAVDTVRAGLDRSVENGTCGTSQLGTEVRSLDFEFRDRVRRRKNDKICSVEEVDVVGIVVDAVQQVVVLRRAQAIGGEGSVRGIAASVRLRSVHSGRQL